MHSRTARPPHPRTHTTPSLHPVPISQGNKGEWTSMGVPADGSYGLGKGVYYSVPVTCEGGAFACSDAPHWPVPWAPAARGGPGGSPLRERAGQGAGLSLLQTRRFDCLCSFRRARAARRRHPDHPRSGHCHGGATSGALQVDSLEAARRAERNAAARSLGWEARRCLGRGSGGARVKSWQSICFWRLRVGCHGSHRARACARRAIPATRSVSVPCDRPKCHEVDV